MKEKNDCDNDINYKAKQKGKARHYTYCAWAPISMSHMY